MPNRVTAPYARQVAILLAALCASLLPAVAAAAPLEPFSATYAASHSGIRVTATRTLTGSDGNWRLDFNASALFAKVNEYSRFSLEGNRITPRHYAYHRTGLGRNRHTELNFETEQRRIDNLREPERSIDQAPKRVHDKISYQLQLALDIAAGREPLRYNVADGKRVRRYEFRVAGREKLQTPMGEVDTIRVERVRDGDAERHTDIWFAPEWNYALVKLRQEEEDGKTYQISLTKLSGA